MRWENLLIALLFVSSFFLFYNSPSDFKYSDVEISRVIDGDTVVLASGEKVRLKGINTPENGMFKSKEAEGFLESYVNKSVELISFGEDKYGRVLGYLFYNGKNLNEEILSSGLAHLYYYDKDKYFSDLEDAEDDARKEDIGIWQHSRYFGCLRVKEFVFLDISETDSEKLVLENSCGDVLDVVIKDDATHIYEVLIEDNFTLETKDIWNDGGDSIYIWDGSGLVLFYRYP
jgi:micrococcal nuclease